MRIKKYKKGRSTQDEVSNVLMNLFFNNLSQMLFSLLFLLYSTVFQLFKSGIY